MMQHQVSDLIEIFNQTFAKSHRTQLIRGGDEPIYIPAKNDNSYHQIFFARGFFSSALHEIAHWLIAGKKRRQLEDYGYWYIPDGRNIAQQNVFEQVEVKPQALEWILADACQFPFQVSVDNLNGSPMDTQHFKAAIIEEKQRMLIQPFPLRTAKLIQALQKIYRPIIG